MEEFALHLDSYRCFFGSRPAVLGLRHGEVIAIVGVNNSGKSSLLRALYELRDVFSLFANGSFAPNESRTVWTTAGQGSFSWRGVADPIDVVPAELSTRGKHTVAFQIQRGPIAYGFVHTGQRLSEQTKTLRILDRKHQYEGWHSQALDSFSRDVAPLLANVVFLGPFRNIANDANQGGTTHYDLPIGESFVAQWRSQKTGTSRQAKLAILETENDLRELFGFSSLEINASDDAKSLQVTIDKKRIHSLAELGSGVAQLIYSVASVALRKPTLLLVDEPELHLHPRLQARFIEALRRHASYGIVFATHSVGLARQVADRILLVTQDPQTGQSTVAPFESNASTGQLLGELSYSQFSAVGGRFLLLVEGVTEVKTFRVWLRKIGIEPEVMILPLGGGALIADKRASELEEFKRIGAVVYVFIDSERSSVNEELDASRKAFADTCRSIFDPDHVLVSERRATENYFSAPALQAVLGDAARPLGPFELPASAAVPWHKTRNWEIAEKMSLGDLDGSDLGEFLSRLTDAVRAEHEDRGADEEP